jgi:hypothetical protein
VISASAWQVPDDSVGEDLYDRLSLAIANSRPRSARDAASRVAIADSKRLYQSGKGLRHLERGLWAAWSLVGHRPSTCAEVWDLLTCQSPAARKTALCGGLDDAAAPFDARSDELDRLHPAFGEVFAAAGVRLVCLRSRAIFPQEFNETVERCGSKGQALSQWTLGLVASILESLGDEPVSILCDKHGGRDHYLPLLMECFPDRFIETHGEGRQRSVYRFGPPERRVEICFQAKGESYMPTAMASMASKYLRELAMHSFNAFWAERVPGLKPTAGYPEDARRFIEQIAPAQRESGINDHILWRVK